MLKEELIDYDPATGRMNSPPRQVFLDLTERCNLACVTCPVDYGRLKTKKQGTMARETIERLYPWIRQALGINLNIVGEPLIHPNFEELLDIHDLPAKNVSFNTNGVAMDERMCRKLVSGPVEAVVVSLDGIESNYPIRGVTYDRIRSNIVNLLDERQRAGNKFPLVGIAYTLMRRNLHELTRVLEDLLPLGVDSVHVQPLIIYYESLLPENIYETPGVDDVLAECRRIADQHGAQLTLFRSTFDEDERNNESSKCDHQMGAVSKRYGCVDPFFEIKILHTGEVMSCSNGLMGGMNVKDHSLDEVWNHPWYTELRKKLCEGRFEDACKRCPYILGSADHQADRVQPGVRHSNEDRFFNS